MTNNTNLRLTNCEAIDSCTIKATFTENLSNNINIDNVIVTSKGYNIPNAYINKVYINNNTLTIKTSLLTPLSTYQVLFQSTPNNPFISVLGNLLYEDGVTNVVMIQTHYNPDNFFYDRLVAYLKDTPYDTEHDGIIKSYIENISSQFFKAYNDIRQSKTDNYLSITVNDELHKRGKGPYDRLLNEGAYEIIRVGLDNSSTAISNTINLTAFPNQISLQQEDVIKESLLFGFKNTLSTFNQTVCTLKYNNVIKITDILIKYADGTSEQYDINTYGYQLQSSKYDDKASTYLELNNNQFKFSEKAIRNGFRIPVAGDNIVVSYIYKVLGRTIDESSIDVYTVCRSIRQVISPLMNVFSLGNTYICDQYGKLCSEDGIAFLNPLSTPPFSSKHPAFQKEITFDENKLPSHIGEYSINYEKGKVYVYGENNNNDGTGAFPPIVTYYYRSTYVNKLDYNYDTTTSDIAANPMRQLIKNAATITYSYKEDLTPDVDYKAQVHTEELTERAENRVLGSGAVQVLHTPITNAFRVYNETSGEIYGINRFNDNTIYFSYQTPPLFVNITNERVRFNQISGESLIKNDEFTNTLNKKIFKLNLGTSIISGTDDCIGSKINTSVSFTDKNVFQFEKYYNTTLNDTQNVNALDAVGKYTINYSTGTIWVAVNDNQVDDIGDISYRSTDIVTNQSHIVGVNKVYSYIDQDNSIKYTVNKFSDKSVSLIKYPISNNITNIVSDTMIELIEEATSVRSIYDSVAIYDNIIKPINFATNCSVSYNIITLNPIEYTSTATIGLDKKTIKLNDIGYTNSNIKIFKVISVKNSTNVELYNTVANNGTFTGTDITLPSDSSGVENDNVTVTVMICLKNNSSVFIDYNRGELYIDYIYCNDEIIISYEHGDNCLDFRESPTIKEDDIYYVSYKYGALRDALFSNFGSLIDMDILHNFNVDLNRERYRDALMACLQTFPKGSTVESITNLTKIISHAQPYIWESFNDEWIIGTSYLYNNKPTTSGLLELVPGKYQYAINVKDSSDSILLPFSSHFKLERGTLEMYVTPNWNGIDNDAEITYSIKRDGITLTADHIWIGSLNNHPTIDTNNNFTISKTELTYGVPSNLYSNNLDTYGVYIYYDVDSNNWKMIAKDTRGNFLLTHKYDITIQTNGEFYNVKPLLETMNFEDSMTTASKKVVIKMIISDTEDDLPKSHYSIDGIQFMSDCEHYLFDYLADSDKEKENRISILKDGNGYLNFRVCAKRDNYNKIHTYQVSKDISNWKKGDTHFVAVSWNIGTKNKRDELHLFVDGQEAFNILKYGGRPSASITDRFRTVVPEIISDPITVNTLTNIDLVITKDSDEVVSNNSDFGLAHINVGDKLYIDNPIINGPNGYFTILKIIDSHTVRLDYTFTYNIKEVVFTVNPITIPITTTAMYESNIAVSIIRNGVESELPGLRANVPAYSITVNEYGQPNLIVRGNAMAGDQVAIRTLGLNHKRVQERIYNWSSTCNQINTELPAPINLDYTKIIPVLLPKTSVLMSAPSINVIMQPSSNKGRTLQLNINNMLNCDFTSQTPLITINGTTASGATSEILEIVESGIYKTKEKFITITNIVCSAVLLQANKTAFVLEVKEAYSITIQENEGNFAAIRYSYKENTFTNTLSGTNKTITSTLPAFDSSHVGYVLVVESPIGSAGYFTITEVIDTYHVNVNQTVIEFTNGSGSLYNVSISRSGYANGQFTFEQAGYAGMPYYLQKGYYDLDYATYLEIPFEIKQTNCAIGSDYNKCKQANAILEEIRSLNIASTDTRIGEAVNTKHSITFDNNNIISYVEDKKTLLLLHLDKKPIIDSSIVYEAYSDIYSQTDQGVNESFNNALYVDQVPFIINNTNILFNKEGTIEFWISPKFDTANDPKYRMFFDTTASYVETVTSLSKCDITLTRPAKYVLSITVNGYGNKNYADECKLNENSYSIKLSNPLPNSNTEITVIYIPYRGNGDRISIYKTPTNSINFDIVGNGKLYSLSAPAFWPRDTWHKITATWKCNSKNKQDEMHLFIDGIEKNKICFGTGMTFGSAYKFSQLTNPSVLTSIKTNITLKEMFNKLYIGGNSFGGAIAHCRIDNLKISSRIKPLLQIGNKLIDNDYALPEKALPVVKDLYTTYLMDFDSSVNKIEDFAILKNQVSGIYDFELDVIDSFDIIENSPKSKEILNTLVKKLKPAVSRAFINYITN